MRHEFVEIAGFAVVTSKYIRDLEGNIVWTIGRPRGSKSYYLDSRFKVETVEDGNFDGFRFRLSACTGFLFFPVPSLGRFAWFKELLRSTAHFSVGLQQVTDRGIVEGLQRELQKSRLVQGGEFA